MKTFLTLLFTLVFAVNICATDYYAYGTSISVGALVTTPYPTTVGSRFGFTVHNNAISNSMVADQGAAVYGHTPASGEIFSIEQGANEERTYLTDYLDPDQNKMSPSDWVAYYRSGLEALVISMTGAAIPATNTSHFTYTGTWANNTSHHAGIGRMTSTPGSKVTWTRTGPIDFVGVGTSDGGNGVFTVSVDGVSQGTFHNYESRAIQTRLGSTYGPKSLPFAVANASHDYALEAVSGTVYFDYEAGTTGVGSKVFIVPSIRQSANGYVWNHGSDDNVAQYNAAAKSLATELKSYGLPVYFANVTDYVSNLDGTEGLSGAVHILPGDATAGRGIHPNQDGTNQMAQAVIDAMTPVVYNFTSPPLMTPLTLLNGWVAYGGSYANPACKVIGGFVKCQGLVKSGTVNATIALVPEAMRSSTTHVFLAEAYYGGEITCRLDVDAGGEIHTMYPCPTNTWVSLDSIFYAIGN